MSNISNLKTIVERGYDQDEVTELLSAAGVAYVPGKDEVLDEMIISTYRILKVGRDNDLINKSLCAKIVKQLVRMQQILKG